MPHRDQILSLQARVEAQEHELEETRSELALSHAAHAHQSLVTERLERQLEELSEEPAEAGFGGGAPPGGPPSEAGGPFNDPRGPWGRGMAFAMVGSVVLFSTMFTLGARRSRMMMEARYAGPPVSTLVREGHVISTVGPEVVAVGESCTVERRPVYAGSFDCRVEVRCGEQVLYGSDPNSGYVRCGGRELVRDPHVTALDGDPAMTLDLARGVVTVEERVGMGTQRVEIAFDAEPPAAAEDAHPLVLRMSEEVGTFDVERGPDGFTVFLVGQHPREGPATIAVDDHPLVERAEVLDHDCATELRVQLVEGASPDYRVLAVDDALVISIGG